MAKNLPSEKLPWWKLLLRKILPLKDPSLAEKKAQKKMRAALDQRDKLYPLW